MPLTASHDFKTDTTLRQTQTHERESWASKRRVNVCVFSLTVACTQNCKITQPQTPYSRACWTDANFMYRHISSRVRRSGAGFYAHPKHTHTVAEMYVARNIWAQQISISPCLYSSVRTLELPMRTSATSTCSGMLYVFRNICGVWCFWNNLTMPPITAQ